MLGGGQRFDEVVNSLNLAEALDVVTHDIVGGVVSNVVVRFVFDKGNVLELKVHIVDGYVELVCGVFGNEDDDHEGHNHVGLVGSLLYDDSYGDSQAGDTGQHGSCTEQSESTRLVRQQWPPHVHQLSHQPTDACAHQHTRDEQTARHCDAVGDHGQDEGNQHIDDQRVDLLRTAVMEETLDDVQVTHECQTSLRILLPLWAAEALLVAVVNTVSFHLGRLRRIELLLI